MGHMAKQNSAPGREAKGPASTYLLPWGKRGMMKGMTLSGGPQGDKQPGEIHLVEKLEFVLI